jgi:hypothetical protein
MGRIFNLLLLLALSSSASACVVAGWSNSDGWFVWPGGLVCLVVAAIIFLVLRRR